MWKNIWKRKEIFLLLLSFLNPKISFFVGKGGDGGVCAERDVTQEGSREGGSWVKKGNFGVT